MHIKTPINYLPKKVSNHKINEVLNHNQNETGGLAQVLEVKAEARVISTVNIDMQDRLVNGQLRTVKHISRNSTDSANKIYVKFDEDNAGLERTHTDNFHKQHFWVQTEKQGVDI